MEKNYILNRESVTLKKTETTTVSLNEGISDFNDWAFKFEHNLAKPLKLNFKFSDGKGSTFFQPNKEFLSGIAYQIIPDVSNYDINTVYTSVEIGSDTDIIVSFTIEAVSTEPAFLDMK